MSTTETIHVRLDYPLEQVKTPVLYYLIREFQLIPSLRRARVNSHEGGWISLELEGTPQNLEAGQTYLREQGIKVSLLGNEHFWESGDEWVI
jgi:hypothetical protein